MPLLYRTVMADSVIKRSGKLNPFTRMPFADIAIDSFNIINK
ncbi:hypothetical protein [Shewanella youngdeokensis]|uniref:Uncharacterized protein n=1 Tax=Shewanella youngdeokensis TaxID=2999068 RepID=A0ABZ0K062_9GAMM|nr:hypothetical protein RGE70_03035 [Shewanella sp. DAU334]